MTEPSESADAVQQSNITEKTTELEQSQSPNSYYTKACDETSSNQYVGNYYAASCLQYPSSNDTQWPLGDVNGYAYAPAYIPYRGYEGYEWYTPEYSPEWSSLDATAQAYTPAGSYYYLDNYAAANGSADALVPDETELEQSFGQLTIDGYGTTYKGWNAVSPQQFLHLGTSKPAEYSNFHNKTKISTWDVPKLDSFYRNNSSTRYWSTPKDSFQKISDKPLEKNVQKYASDQDSPDTSLYNQKEFDIDLSGARYFVIKSYSEDDIHRSIKYGIWCSTEYGNKRLDAAFREREGMGPIYLLFSVNGSGHFCGVAVMTSTLDYSSSANVWAQNKWKGKFDVRWIYVKDVPNSQLRHIKLENNENKPVTNSRDTQEVPGDKGKQVLYIIHQYRHTTSIFDDFNHYEQRLLEESKSKPLG